WIRTTDPSVPNRVLYQAEPRPDKARCAKDLRATAGNRRAEQSLYPNAADRRHNSCESPESTGFPHPETSIMRTTPRILSTLFTVALFATPTAGSSNFPDPTTDPKSTSTTAEAVLAGGCFWGVEAVFERLNGVKDVVSGFSGGARAASYEVVSTGTTGHAESVKITYDPTKIS